MVLALVAAIDPVRIGIVTLLISRPRPMLNLLVFWLAGIAAGTAAALLLLLVLRDRMLSVIRVVRSTVSGSGAAPIQVAIGVIAVLIAGLIAARFWVRQRAPVPVTGGEPSVLVLEQNTRSGSRRLSIRRKYHGESLVLACVAGVAWATPPVEYLTAIIAILASRADAAAQVCAALMFTLVAFTAAEIPLISYLVIPAKTLTVVLRLQDWISVRRQRILAVVVGAAGVLLVVAGIDNGCA
jgi:hypothetical protein